MGERLAAWPLWARLMTTLAAQAVLLLLFKGIGPYVPLGDHAMPYIVFTMAVAYFLGVGPAVLAVVTGFLLFDYFTVTPLRSIWPIADNPDAWGQVVVYLLGTVLVGFATILIKRNRDCVFLLAQDLSIREKEFRALIETSPDIISRIDRELRYRYVNPAITRETGIPQEQFIGKTAEEAGIPAESAHPWNMTLKTAIDTRKEQSVETTYNGLHGTHYFHIRMVPELADDGSVDSVLCVSHDITENKQIERALRESRDDLNRAQAVAQTGSWRLDIRNNRLDWSDEVYDLFGISKEAPLSYETFLNTVHPEDRELVDQHWKAALEGGDYNIDHRILVDGTVKWVRERAELEFDSNGHVVGGFGTVQDITERKQIEQELIDIRNTAEKNYAELQSIISSMADGVVVIDVDGNIQMINESGWRIIDAPESMRQHFNWMKEIHRFTLNGEPLPEEQAALSYALREEVVENRRYKLVTNWGKEVPVNASASPIRDVQGKVIGATLVFRDDSEQIELEHHRQMLYEREHHIARTLQQALVPPIISLEVGQCKMAMRYQAAFKEAEVGGDFYDIFELSDGRVGIVIGDVAGKGLSAAIHVAAAKHSIRSYAYLYDSPSRVMALANDILCKAQIAEQSDTSFLTVFFVVIDTQHQTITYVNAGHEPPLVVNKNGIYDELESSGDLALGILGNQIYTEFNRALHQGDLVVAVTDGITEARQDVSKLFGKEGILDVLLHELKTPVEEIPIKLLDAARSYAGGELQDDAAIVAFTCNHHD